MSGPGSASREALFEAGRRALEGGAAPAAVDAFERCLAHAPGDPFVLHHLAQAFISLERWSDARGRLEEALRGSPGNPVLLTDLGIVLDEVGDPAAAERCWEAAASAEPVYPIALYNHAQSLLRRGETVQAVALLGRAVAEAPRLVEAWRRLAEVARGAGDFERAEDCYRRAHELDGRVATRLERAACLQELGREGEALAEYRAALGRDGARPYDVMKRMTGVARGRFSLSKRRLAAVLATASTE